MTARMDDSPQTPAESFPEPVTTPMRDEAFKAFARAEVHRSEERAYELINALEDRASYLEDRCEKLEAACAQIEKLEVSIAALEEKTRRMRG